MLNDTIKPINFATFEIEEWENYCERVGITEESEAKKQFYRQVVYDHFDHHNNHYPTFEIDQFNFELIELSVAEVNEKIRYFNNRPLNDWWGAQYDEFEQADQQYIIYQFMSQNHTVPFPPILIDSTSWENKDALPLGSPLHLVEGTHRVSYLLRMAERGIISWGSRHEFVLLTR